MITSTAYYLTSWLLLYKVIAENEKNDVRYHRRLVLYHAGKLLKYVIKTLGFDCIFLRVGFSPRLDYRNLDSRQHVLVICWINN